MGTNAMHALRLTLFLGQHQCLPFYGSELHGSGDNDNTFVFFSKNFLLRFLAPVNQGRACQHESWTPDFNPLSHMTMDADFGQLNYS